jgi:hypothetical protein
MRKVLFTRIALIVSGGLAGAVTMSLTVAQTPVPNNPPPPYQLPGGKLSTPIQPVSTVKPAMSGAVVPPPAVQRAPVPYDQFRNLELLPEQTRQMVMSALKGMEWLHRYNQNNGLFLRGYLPAVNQTLEGENYLEQSMAAFVLSRSARFTGDERYAVRASQTALTLLTRTIDDPPGSGTRRPAEPSIVCNRLAMAGFLVMAIHELPEPTPELLARAEELCAFIGRQQREDGSLSYVDAPTDDPLSVDPEGVNKYPGPALAALAMSLRSKPTPAKIESLGKAVVYYRKWFREHPHPDMTPWMTAACADAYAATKDNRFAEFALEMNDWLCALQYVESPDPRRPLWRGGFKKIADGKLQTAAPGIEAALYAQSLADCCRLIRQMPNPDVQRHERCREAAIRSLQFLSTLQFSESNTMHISVNYRDLLVGGFHPTHADGNLRIDQTAAGVSAFVQFLVSGADKAQ